MQSQVRLIIQSRSKKITWNLQGEVFVGNLLSSDRPRLNCNNRVLSDYDLLSWTWHDFVNQKVSFQNVDFTYGLGSDPWSIGR